MSKKPFIAQLEDMARELSSRAAHELLSSERRADALGNAVRAAQDARALIDEQGAKLVAAMGFATTTDLERLSRKIGRVRKRLSAILDRLDG